MGIALKSLPLLVMASCVAPDTSTRTLTDAGYIDIEITGWSPLRCGDDFFETGFQATNIRGKKVKGTVCCGLILKNCTIRH